MLISKRGPQVKHAEKCWQASQQHHHDLSSPMTNANLTHINSGHHKVAAGAGWRLRGRNVNLYTPLARVVLPHDPAIALRGEQTMLVHTVREGDKSPDQPGFACTWSAAYGHMTACYMLHSCQQGVDINCCDHRQSYLPAPAYKTSKMNVRTSAHKQNMSYIAQRGSYSSTSNRHARGSLLKQSGSIGLSHCHMMRGKKVVSPGHPGHRCGCQAQSTDPSPEQLSRSLEQATLLRNFR
jgi:hypothetical protein